MWKISMIADEVWTDKTQRREDQMKTTWNGEKKQDERRRRAGLNRCHCEVGRTTDLSKRTWQEREREGKREKEREREETLEWKEAESGGREDRARSLSRRICILIRNLAESFLSDLPSFPILFLAAPRPTSGLVSPKDKRRPLALPPSRLPLPVFSSHIPVLFLPHYAGLVYPGLVPHF